ncbi:MAG: hypothetical protein J0I20_09155 [Chloroflexi bacterium]|nr:hypothetical protein [Chloroflexota bacterium]OJV96987.1 MAG: hypothetical protein BGO39_18385 [Chloroflexi bacterium 54-19]
MQNLEKILDKNIGWLYNTFIKPICQTDLIKHFYFFSLFNIPNGADFKAFFNVDKKGPQALIAGLRLGVSLTSLLLESSLRYLKRG